VHPFESILTLICPVDNQQTLLGTIYFISLFFPFDATSDPLKVAITRWLKLRGRGDVVPPKGKAALDSTFVDEVRRLLLAFIPWRAAVRATHSAVTSPPHRSVCARWRRDILKPTRAPSR
jgi:hypothetical protein